MFEIIISIVALISILEMNKMNRFYAKCMAMTFCFGMTVHSGIQIQNKYEKHNNEIYLMKLQIEQTKEALMANKTIEMMKNEPGYSIIFVPKNTKIDLNFILAEDIIFKSDSIIGKKISLINSKNKQKISGKIISEKNDHLVIRYQNKTIQVLPYKKSNLAKNNRIASLTTSIAKDMLKLDLQSFESRLNYLNSLKWWEITLST